MMRRTHPHHLLEVLLLSMLICLIGAGMALFSQGESGQRSHAKQSVDPSSVIGQPTLPAATVDAIFARMGSPMHGTGKVVEQAARQTNIDDAFALGVWWTETNDGAAGVGSADRNPGSVRGSAGYPAAFDGYTIYPSYAVAITDWFNLLRNRYVNRGLTTVYAIASPYVGTSSSPLWAGKVVALMQKYRAEAPPLPRPPDQVANTLQTPRPTVQLSTSLRNHPRPRSLGATADLRSQSEAAIPTNAAQNTANPALSLTTKYGVVFLGLLVALTLALYGLALDGKLRLPRPAPATATFPAVAVATPQPQFALASGSTAFLEPLSQRQELLSQRQTDELIPLTLPPLRPSFAPRVGLPARSQVQEQDKEIQAMPPRTEPLSTGLRRVMLVSSQTPRPSQSQHTPVPVHSGVGLLSRYRETQQREAPFL